MVPAARPSALRWTELRAKPVRNVAGLMSGTSMDGLDVGLCRIRSTPRLEFELVAFETVPFPAESARGAGLGAACAGPRRLARLDAALGRFFADALGGRAAQRHPFELELIGSHGQTVYHEHAVTTLQLGAPAAMALRFGCPVVHDFRANDIAAGGAGAPLVPYVDARLLGGRGSAVLAVNIGGIANFTALPAQGDDLGAVLGMDCGPGNMVLDQLAARFSAGAQAADIDGRLAARGAVRAGAPGRARRAPVLRRSAAQVGRARAVRRRRSSTPCWPGAARRASRTGAICWRPRPSSPRSASTTPIGGTSRRGGRSTSWWSAAAAPAIRS